MPSSHDRLRKAVFAELQKQRSQAEGEAPIDRAKVFGTFVDVALNNLGISRSGFARTLHIEDELANAILDGLLPESEIDDAFLADIAQAIQYEPNLLRVMLGRKAEPTGHEGTVH